MPTFKIVIASIQGLKPLENEYVIEISKNHKVLKSDFSNLIFYTLVEVVNKGEPSEKEFKLKSIDDDYESIQESEKSDDKASKNTFKNSEFIENPVIIFNVINSLYDFLNSYFEYPLTMFKIKNNIDTLSNILQEFLEAGHPYITDNNLLKKLIPMKTSLGSKLISTTNELTKSFQASNLSLNSSSNSADFRSDSLSSRNSFNGNGSSTSLNSEYPWRSSNLRYTKNELFVDIVEKISLIMSFEKTKKSKSKKDQKNIFIDNDRLVPISACIVGTVDFTSHLSGVPEIYLDLNLNNHNLGVPGFHRCINKARWEKEKILVFVPPDGRTKIMEYYVDLDLYKNNLIIKNCGLIQPFYKRKLGLKKNEFEISLQINLSSYTTKIDNLQVEIDFKDLKFKILRLSHGDFQVKSNGKNIWNFDAETPLGITAVFRGAMELPEEETQDKALNIDFPEHISISYSNRGSLPSGIRVATIKVNKGLQNITPFKGVKYITTTDKFLIR